MSSLPFPSALRPRSLRRRSVRPRSLRPRSLQRRVLRLALARWPGAAGTRSGGTPSGGLDVTTLSRLPDRATWPLRRVDVHPPPGLDEIRGRAPVHRLTSVLGMNVWLVTGHAEARDVLADSTAYSNDMRHLLGDRERTAAEGIGGLGMTDAPDHTRLRKLLTPEFTARRLARLEGRIDAIVAQTLDDLARNGPEGDLVPDFGFAVPFRVICELLGLPLDVREEFSELGTARFDISRGTAGTFDAATESRAFLIDAVARQRADPGDGLIGAILTHHGHEFDDVEIGGLADGVFLGGYETSASMLSLGTYVLSRNPATYARLADADDLEANRVVDELLRYLCPVQVAFPRFARADHELFGQQVREGDVVAVSLNGANRDPGFVSDPDSFDPTRQRGGHLAFGHGLHRCVGAELARMELRVALRGLARRFPKLVVDARPDELAFRELSAVYGLDRLPVRLWDGPRSDGPVMPPAA